MVKKLRKFASRFKRLLKQANLFILLGFLVIPIPRRRKAPSLKGWTKIRINSAELERYFDPGCNLGVVLGETSGGLVDVDLDCDEAVRAARFRLLHTGLIHGRASKPDSHHWFISTPCPPPCRFTDTDGTVLVELRSSGQQTIIPPSIHPNGEELHWESSGVPASVSPEVLVRSVRRLAGSTLVARHYPSKGSRHETDLALAGFLLRSGWDPDEVKTFITAAAFASSTDEEWHTRQRDVESTVIRLRSGLPATGIPRLASILGDAVVSRLVEWLEIRLEAPATNLFHHVVSWPEPADADAFHGLAGEIVSAIEPHSEADPIALLIQLLVAVGNIVGRRSHFHVEGDLHFPNLFSVLVGTTSKARKGSSLSQIQRFLRDVDPSWSEAHLVSGISSGEGLIWSVRDRILSVTGDSILDEGVTDKRLLIVESEFAQPLRHMLRPQNILSTVIRQAWDSGNLRTLTRHSPVQATGAHISVVGHITLAELRRNLSSIEIANGFANRILWLLVKRSKILPEGGRLERDDLSYLASRLQTVIEWSKAIREVRRSPKARKLWSEIYPELSEGKAGLLGAVTSRAEAQVTRLSLLNALLDRSSTIKTKHIRAALALWKYSESSARFIFGDSLGDPIADGILSALRASPSGLTRTEISEHFNRHVSSSRIAAALVVIAENGLASCKASPSGGRPDERWFVLSGVAQNAK